MIKTFKRVFLALLVVLVGLCVACSSGISAEEAANSIELANIKNITEDFTVPTEVEGFKGTITWTSDAADVVRFEGNVAKVTRPAFTTGAAVRITLTVTCTNKDDTYSKNITITVAQLEQTDAQKFAKDFTVDTIPATAQEGFTVPVSAEYNGKAVTIAWASNVSNVTIDAQGNATVVRPSADAANVDVVLTATITIDGQTATKEFTLTVAKEAKLWTDFEAMFGNYAAVVAESDGDEEIDYLGVEGWILADYSSSAMSQTSYLITDGKGYSVYVYGGLEEGYAVGDKIVAYGDFVSYFYMPELKNVTLTKVAGEEKTVAELTAEIPTVSIADAKAILTGDNYKSSLAKYGQLLRVEGLLRDSSEQSSYCEIVDVNNSENYIHVYKYMVYQDMKDAYGSVKSVVLYLHDYYGSIGGGRFGAVGGTLQNVELTDAQKVDFVKKAVEALNGTEVVTDIKLPSMDGVTITWTSSNEAALGIDGKVSVVDADTVVTLTAAISCGESTATATAEITVKALEVTPIVDAKKLADKEVVKIAGKVVAASVRGYVVYDGTDALYVYAHNSTVDAEKNFTYVVGDYVEVTGVTGYYSGEQLVPSVSKKLEAGNIADPEAKSYAAAELEAYISGKVYPTELVTITATVTISGSYINLVVDQTSIQGSVTYVTDAQKELLNPYKDKTVVITGWTMGQSSGKYVNMIMVSVAEPEYTPEEKLAKAEADLKALGTSYAGTGNVTLPTELYGAAITWATSDANVMTADGKAATVEEATEVTLTATVTLEGQEPKEVAVVFTVKPLEAITVAEAVDAAIAAGGSEAVVKIVAKVIGLYAASKGNSPIFADATGAIYSYNFVKDYCAELEVGKVVEAVVKVKIYNTCAEISGVVSSKVVETEVTPVQPEEVAESAFVSLEGKTAADVFAMPIHNKLVKVTGVVTKSGDYYNVVVNGVNLSVKGADVSAYEGRTVTLTGLLTDANVKSLYWNIYLYGLEDQLVVAPEGLVASFGGTNDALTIWTEAGMKLHEVTDAATGTHAWLGNGWRYYVVCDSEGKVCYAVAFPPNGYGGPNGTGYYCHPSYSDYTTNPAIKILEGFGPWVSGGTAHNLFEIQIPEGGFAITAHDDKATGMTDLAKELNSEIDTTITDWWKQLNTRTSLNENLRISYTSLGEIKAEIVSEEPEQPEQPSEPVLLATMTFEAGNRKEYDESSKQVWEHNGITLTNLIGTAKSIGDYVNPIRCYANTELSISYTSAFTKIVITTTGSKNFNAAATFAGANVTVNGTTCVLEFDTPVTSFDFGKLAYQVRFASVQIWG